MQVDKKLVQPWIALSNKVNFIYLDYTEKVGLKIRLTDVDA